MGHKCQQYVYVYGNHIAALITNFQYKSESQQGVNSLVTVQSPWRCNKTSFQELSPHMSLY